MVADLEFIKSKIKDLSRRWEVIQIYKGLDADGGSFDWDTEKKDETDTHYHPDKTKQPSRFSESINSHPIDNKQVRSKK